MLFALSRVQRGLEALYRVETELDINDFLIDSDTRATFGVSRHAREQLLLSQAGDVGLFVCDTVLSNLGRNDPARRLDDSNFGDFLLAVEGVSHFVYLAWKASVEHRVSGLELELQAEIDKYVTLILHDDDLDHHALHRRLFYGFELEPDLCDEERHRYLKANRTAASYTSWLASTFLSGGKIAELLAEVRRFYRMPLAHKLSHVSAL